MIIVTLDGSHSPDSRAAQLLAYLGECLAYNAQDVRALAARELPAGELARGAASGATRRQLDGALSGADAVVVLTPVCQGAYSGLLKSCFDLLADDALSGKVVLPIAVGRDNTHQLSIQHALKPVLDAVGARLVLGCLYITENHLRVHDDGLLVLDHATENRLEAGLGRLLDALGDRRSEAATVRMVPRHARRVRCRC